MRKNIKIAISFLIIFSVIPYLPEALFCVFNGIPVNAKYKVNFNYFRYIKDIVLLILFILLTFDYFKNYKKTKFTINYIKLAIVLFIIVTYGTISLIFDGYFSIAQIASGLRSLLLLFTLLISINYIDKCYINKVYMILVSLLYFEILISLLQFVIVAKHYGFSEFGRVRIIGTFGGVGSLGYLAFGVSLFVYMFYKHYTMKRRIFYIHQIACIFLSVISGTRATIMLCGITLIYSIYDDIKSNLKYTMKKYTDIVFAVVAIVMVIILIKISTLIADRGNILSVQLNSGRIKFLVDYFKTSTLKQIILGSGIGYGTNTAIFLNKQLNLDSISRMMDGTFNTIITQYGIVILISMLVYISRYLIKLIKNYKCNLLDIGYLVGVSFIMAITTNIFEQFVFMIPYIYSLFIFINSLEKKQLNYVK